MVQSYTDADHKYAVNVAWCAAANTLVTVSKGGAIVLYSPTQGLRRAPSACLCAHGHGAHGIHIFPARPRPINPVREAHE